MLPNMPDTLLSETRSRCPDLGEFLEGVCAQPFNFEGPEAIVHSSYNHTHLWALEWWAEHHQWIDLSYRVAFVERIFEHWKARLKGLAPYRVGGYRLYLYQDLAPTVSVVAETPQGCPYGGDLKFVSDVRNVMEPYVKRRWSENFTSFDWPASHNTVLAEVEKHSGSISKPTAEALGVSVGQLRTLIEQMGLEVQVNKIRKRYKRRPALFRDELELETELLIYERRLPAGYR